MIEEIKKQPEKNGLTVENVLYLLNNSLWGVHQNPTAITDVRRFTHMMLNLYQVNSKGYKDTFTKKERFKQAKVFRTQSDISKYHVQVTTAASLIAEITAQVELARQGAPEFLLPQLISSLYHALFYADVMQEVYNVKPTR